MKNLLGASVGLLAFSLAGIAAPQEGIYSGEIMDSMCAKAGSHDAMMKRAGLTSAKDCTQACVKNGGKYVLYNKTSNKVYQLDDQTKAEQLAGEKVTIKGSLDSATSTIHVTEMEPAKGTKKSKASSHPGI